MKHSPFWRGLLRTVLTLALSLFLLSLLVFVIAHYAPGDPLRAYFGDRVEKMSVDERAWAEAKLGLDRPVLTQYGIWLQNALHGDFGISYKYKMDVLEVIRTRLPYTLRLGGVGFVLLFVLSLGVGVLCARHEDSLLDRILCRVGTVMSCVPEFWLSLVLIVLFAVELRWLPSSGAYSVGGDGGFADRAVHLILPVTVVVLGHLWYYAYLVRSRLIEELHADYILLAKGKGLPKRTVLLRHALRNVLPSYLSIMAISVPHILGGTYIVGTVFSYPGLGTLSYESARYQDYNLLMVLCIVALALFTVRSAAVGRSSFYTIGACTASSILVVQTILNTLGTVDVLPLTGVTFPFVSNGGSSMICAWGLLAFVKAADTRQNASFAVRMNKNGGTEDE